MNNNEEILDSKIDDLYMVFVINNQKYALSSKYITEIIVMLVKIIKTSKENE